MTAKPIMVAIECKTNIPERLRWDLDHQFRIHHFVVKRLHLGGGVPVWILVAHVPIKALGFLLDGVVQYKPQDDVLKIKVAETEIEAPTLEDIDRLKQEALAQAMLEASAEKESIQNAA